MNLSTSRMDGRLAGATAPPARPSTRVVDATIAKNRGISRARGAVGYLPALDVCTSDTASANLYREFVRGDDLWPTQS